MDVNSIFLPSVIKTVSHFEISVENDKLFDFIVFSILNDLALFLIDFVESMVVGSIHDTIVVDDEFLFTPS